MCQANTGSSQKGEEKIKEKCRQMSEAVKRRETALLTELRRVTTERQSAIDAELERIRYNITRFDAVFNPFNASRSRLLLSEGFGAILV